MNRLATILEDFCGCTGPAFDSKTGRLTEEGSKAYQILKNIISKLDELEIIDAKNAAFLFKPCFIQSYACLIHILVVHAPVLLDYSNFFPVRSANASLYLFTVFSTTSSGSR